MSKCYRTEHPRPDFERQNWLNLNGKWEFEIDTSVSGKERKLYNAQHLSSTIQVPFCPESELSGVGYKDFMNCVWYRKEIKLPDEWLASVKNNDERIILHFGAVDYYSTVYINGVEKATHKGGFSPFQIDITDEIDSRGTATVVLCAEDNLRSRKQPGGKQSRNHFSYGCYYTRTTGIWQTVWLEMIPQNHITSIKIFPDTNTPSVTFEVKVSGSGFLSVNTSYNGNHTGSSSTYANSNTVFLKVNLKEKHLWETGKGGLYDLNFTFDRDQVKSYLGLREVLLDGYKFLINGKSVFQRLVLDQGFYPDGVYTAIDDSCFINDIKISMAAGFNGARLHQKAFEPRFLYHCDKMGYLVWGEYGNWSLNISDYEALSTYLPEWTEVVCRDFNHPSIIGWIPLNETWDIEGRRQRDEVIKNVYLTTKQIDPTRPCIDASGHFHVVTDIFDVHDYEQDPLIFKEHYQQLEDKNILFDVHSNRQTYNNEAVFVSEYGGIKLDLNDGNNDSGWGYGDGPKSIDEFIERYRGLTEVLLRNKKMFGFCYTQLYDVEQEKNGIYTYERKAKFDINIIREINVQKAAIEAE